MLLTKDLYFPTIEELKESFNTFETSEVPVPDDNDLEDLKKIVSLLEYNVRIANLRLEFEDTKRRLNEFNTDQSVQQ